MKKKLPIQKKYKNLVLCGGGSKCIAFCGAIKFLEEYNTLRKLKHIIGVSAGAIVGLFLILGYTYKEIEEKIDSLNNDIVFGAKCSFAYTIYNLCVNYGTNNNTALYNYLRNIFIEKEISPDITFEELYIKFNIDFTVGATNLSHKKLTAFNRTNTPFVSVIRSIMASTCIPFIFKPINIDGTYYVDGGLKNNFPISLVPKKEYTIALRLETYDEHENIDIDNSFFSYINTIIDIIFSNTWADEKITVKNKKIDIYRIKIPNINFMDFDLDTNIKHQLRNSGYDTLERNFLAF